MKNHKTVFCLRPGECYEINEISFFSVTNVDFVEKKKVQSIRLDKNGSLNILLQPTMVLPITLTFQVAESDRITKDGFYLYDFMPMSNKPEAKSDQSPITQKPTKNGTW